MEVVVTVCPLQSLGGCFTFPNETRRMTVKEARTRQAIVAEVKEEATVSEL